MTTTPYHPVNARGQLVRDELRRMGRAVQQHDRTATAGGVLLGQGAGGPVILGRPPRKIWTAITGGANPYAHQQQKVFFNRTTLALDASDHLEGISGTTTDLPAFEINTNRAVPNGRIVRARLAWSNDHYLFDECCSDRFAPIDDFPSGDVPSGSGIGGTGRNHYLSCCPSLLLPPVLAFHLVGWGNCPFWCFNDMTFPLYWNGIDPHGPTGTSSGYAVAVVPSYYGLPPYDTMPPYNAPPYYPDPSDPPCLEVSDEFIVTLGCVVAQ